MEVLVGAAAAAAAAGPHHGLFFTEEEEEVHKRVGSEKSPGEDSSSSSSSSSIGQPDDDDDTEDEASSHKESGVLGSLDSLEDALPIKRGLSNHFSGKSKSFANLSEVTSVADNVKEIEKPDHPFNKRRRIFLANKWASASKKSSFYSWHNPKSMPLLALEEDDRGELDEAQEEEDQVIKGRAFSSCSSSSCCSSSSSSSTEKKKQDPQKDKDLLQDKWGGGILAPPRLGEIRFKGSTPFKSQSCLSLTDLQ